MGVDDLQILAGRLQKPPPQRRLWGVIDDVNTGPPSTLNVFLSGSTTVVPGLRYRDNLYNPAAGDVVEVEREGTDLVVVGRLANEVPTTPSGTGSAFAGPYVYTQASPAATWTINHTLGYRPSSIGVFDSTGAQVEGDVQVTSASQVVITFSGAFAGTARLI